MKPESKLKIQKFIRKILFYKVFKFVNDKIEFRKPYNQFYLDCEFFKLYQRVIEDYSFIELYNIVMNQLKIIQDIIKSTEINDDLKCLEITGLNKEDLIKFIGE